LPEAEEFACELGVALRASGDSDRSQEVLAAATDSSEQRIELRARIELALGRSVIEPDTASELLEVALSSIPTLQAEHDDRALGRAYLCVAHVKGGFYCEYGAMEDSAASAVTHYTRAGWSPSTALDYLGNALYFGPTPVPEAVGRCTRLLGEHDGDRASEANIIVWLGGLEAMRKNFSEARAHVSRAKTIYQEFGLPQGALDTCNRAFAAIDRLAGMHGQAEQALRAACEVLQQSHQTAVLATRAGELAQSIYEQRRYEEAEVWTRLASTSAGTDDLDAALSWQPVKAKLLARQGRIAEGERLARENLELVGRTDSLNRHGDAFIALAEILGVANRREEAEDMIRSAIGIYALKGNLASADRARALIPDGALAE
jgi:tetratricopeptide (TPR) repeat protein